MDTRRFYRTWVDHNLQQGTALVRNHSKGEVLTISRIPLSTDPSEKVKVTVIGDVPGPNNHWDMLVSFDDAVSLMIDTDYPGDMTYLLDVEPPVHVLLSAAAVLNRLSDDQLNRSTEEYMRTGRGEVHCDVQR